MKKIFFTILPLLCPGAIFAQYPVIPPAMEAKADSIARHIQDLSDQQFEKVKPIIDRDAKNGKPFIPWAAKPSDLPQAKLPAFPGAEGGGAYSFGGRGGKVLAVTSSEASGRGRVRAACEAGGPRRIGFSAAGIRRTRRGLGRCA